MVLIAIVGELGSGKTLTLAYMCWNNWVKKKRKIFTNFPLFGIPHVMIKSIEGFFKMIPPETTEEEIFKGEEKFFAGDELWRWVDSRMIGMGARERNKIISNILLASRKSFVTIAYTTQSLHQIDKRILDVTDLVFCPQMSPDKKYITVYIFSGGRKPYPSGIPPFIFNCEPIYAIYNTFYKVQEITEKQEDFSEKNHRIIENPAWRWYLMKFYKFDEKKIEKISEEFEKRIKDEDYPHLVLD